MHQALADLKLISGVMGAFVFDQKKGILASEVPPNFKRDKLAQAGRMVIKSIAAGRAGYPEIKDLVFNFAEMFILVRELRQGAILIVMCHNSLNVNLLVMSLNLAIDEITPLADLPPEEGGEVQAAPSPAPPPPQPQATAPAPPPTPRPQGSARSYESIMEDKNIGPLVGELKSALAKVVGPMAAIVVQDSVKIWAQSSDPSKASLPALVEIICKDVGNIEQCNKFRALISGIVG